jgi:hypothetical protein
MSEQERDKDHAGLSAEQMRDNVVRHAFAGDRARFEQFVEVIRAALPPDAAAVLRGSAVTNVRWEDGGPFDAEGPGTSDLDLTPVGGNVLDWFHPEGFYISRIHSKPLSQKDPDIAPELLPLRERLGEIAGRPVNIQGTRNWIMFVREYMMGQPYLTLVGKVESEPE